MSKILLYSGGMDSYMMSFLLKPDICLYVDSKSIYAKKELKHLPTPPCGSLIYKSNIDLKEFERHDLIVPQRNAYLCLLAAHFGEEIWLGATYGDRSSDKDTTFVYLMNSLLKHLWQPSHWNQRKPPIVAIPFKDKTKVEIMHDYIEAGGDTSVFENLPSCYDEEALHCGKCKACARYWVALILNHQRADFFQNFPGDYFTSEIRSKARSGSYRGEREDKEILKALEVAGV